MKWRGDLHSGLAWGLIAGAALYPAVL